MNRNPARIAAAVIAGMAAIAALQAGLAQTSEPTVSLRGDLGITDPSPPPATVKQALSSDGFGRAYRQQPPLIPHRIDGYQVSKDYNKCMTCHDWPDYAKVGAPKISETHYRDRDNRPLDRVSNSRWFCTQCHVPQADTPALVENLFRSAAEGGAQ